MHFLDQGLYIICNHIYQAQRIFYTMIVWYVLHPIKLLFLIIQGFIAWDFSSLAQSGDYKHAI